MENLSMSTADTSFVERYPEFKYLAKREILNLGASKVPYTDDNQSHISRLRPNKLPGYARATPEAASRSRMRPDADTNTAAQTEEKLKPETLRQHSETESSEVSSFSRVKRSKENGKVDDTRARQKYNERAEHEVRRGEPKKPINRSSKHKARGDRRRKESISQCGSEESRKPRPWRRKQRRQNAFSEDSQDSDTDSPHEARLEHRHRRKISPPGTKYTRPRRIACSSSSRSSNDLGSKDMSHRTSTEAEKYSSREKRNTKHDKTRGRELSRYVNSSDRNRESSKHPKFRHGSSSSSCSHRGRHGRKPDRARGKSRVGEKSVKPSLRDQGPRDEKRKGYQRGGTAYEKECRRNNRNISFRERDIKPYSEESSESSYRPTRREGNTKTARHLEGKPPKSTTRSDRAYFETFVKTSPKGEHKAIRRSNQELSGNETDSSPENLKAAHKPNTYVGQSSQNEYRDSNIHVAQNPERRASFEILCMDLNKEQESQNMNENGFSRRENENGLLTQETLLTAEETSKLEEWGTPAQGVDASLTLYPRSGSISSPLSQYHPAIINTTMALDCIVLLLPENLLAHRKVRANPSSVQSLMRMNQLTEACELATRGSTLRQMQLVEAIALEVDTLFHRWEWLAGLKILKMKAYQVQSVLRTRHNLARFMVNSFRTLDHLRAALNWWKSKLDRYEEKLFPDWLKSEKEFTTAQRLISRLSANAMPEEITSLVAEESHCARVLRSWLILSDYPFTRSAALENRESVKDAVKAGCAQGCPLSVAIASASSRVFFNSDHQDLPSQMLLESKRRLYMCSDEDSMERSYQALMNAAKFGLYDSAIEYCLNWKRSDLKTLKKIYDETGMMAVRYGWALAAGTDTGQPDWDTAIEIMTKDIKSPQIGERYIKIELAVVACRLLEQMSATYGDEDDDATLMARRRQLETAIHYLLDASQRKALIACNKLSRILRFGEFGLPGGDTDCVQRPFYKVIYAPHQFSSIVNWDTLENPFSPHFTNEVKAMRQWEKSVSACVTFKCMRRRIQDFYAKNKSCIDAEVLSLQLPWRVSYRQPTKRESCGTDWTAIIEKVDKFVKCARDAYKNKNFQVMFAALAEAFIQADVAVMLPMATMQNILEWTEVYRQRNHKDPRVILVACHLWLRLRRHPGTLTSKIRPKENPAVAQQQSHKFVSERAAITDLEGDLMCILGYSDWAILNWQEADRMKPTISRKFKIVWEQFKTLLKKKLSSWDRLGETFGMEAPFLDPQPLGKLVLEMLADREVISEASPYRRDLIVILVFLTLRNVSQEQTLRWIKEAVRAEAQCSHILHSGPSEEYLVLKELLECPKLLHLNSWRQRVKGRLAGQLMQYVHLSCSARLYNNIHSLLLEVGADDMAADYFSRRGVILT
eukprot:Gregarina_sp_Poly_1__9965@NODE_65_length_16489_cov_69_850445_g56_i0_p1_GENE_NODE_65_length_16489_cov_69_850445_g56_i0NODE_65_length_16489_cov_69_850445_g56_i0_p1_ORF_typecomplete_len1388_score178_36ACI44/PF15270_6/0_46_NODE_65_length_16489_cov_69_850445_g56_i042488411